MKVFFNYRHEELTVISRIMSDLQEFGKSEEDVDLHLVGSLAVEDDWGHQVGRIHSLSPDFDEWHYVDGLDEPENVDDLPGFVVDTGRPDESADDLEPVDDACLQEIGPMQSEDVEVVPWCKTLGTLVADRYDRIRLYALTSDGKRSGQRMDVYFARGEFLTRGELRRVCHGLGVRMGGDTDE